MNRIVLFVPTLTVALFGAAPVVAQTLYVHGGARFPSSSAFKNACQTG